MQPPTPATVIVDNVERNTPQGRKKDGITNASVVQIISGLTCIGLQVYLYASYHDADESILDGNTVFTFCVGIFGLMAGILGYFVHSSRQWINFGYLAASLGVVSSSIMYFLAGYWDFYAAVKESGEFFYITDSNVDAEQIPNSLLTDGEFKFWLQAGLFICVIVLALFSLAGMAIVASYRFCHRSSKKEDYKSLLVD